MLVPLGTYAAALLLIAASIPVGAAVLVAAGRREWSWIAPALGLALLTAAAWLAVRLPGEGLTALIVLVALAAAAAAWALPRLRPERGELLGLGLPTAALALAAVSIPFAAEGHFGILGTGFNVDMSQHLFAAEWISSQLAPAPDLIRQGYPVGPHSLAVATGELGAAGGGAGGGLVQGFTGITIAVPVIAALTALAAVRSLGGGRAVLAALLVGLPYLIASYLAQGSFKELLEAVFALAFAVWLWELRSLGTASRGFALPGAALAVGALYAYSGPGLAWLLGALAGWALIELIVDRRGTVRAVRRAAPGIALAALLAALLVAPEATRIADFGTSAGNVARASGEERSAAAALHARAGTSDTDERAPGAGDRATDPDRALRFNDELGNLFGHVNPLQVLGIWPSGDFRVQPGDGAVPALAFYAGALVGIGAFMVGLRLALRRREWALIAALGAAAAIWLAAYAVSTPYTTAKALQILAPLITLIAVRGVLDPRFATLPAGRPAGRLAAVALAVAFSATALASSALALANAPVGPERYSAGLALLRDRLAAEPVLMLVPAGQLANRHGAAYYGWELRGARPICVEAIPGSGAFGSPAPSGVRYVITLGGKREPPFEGLVEDTLRRRVTLWEVAGFERGDAPAVPIDEHEPTSCELGLP